MKATFVSRSLIIAGMVAFAGTASAQSVVIHEQSTPPVVVEHQSPPVVVEHERVVEHQPPAVVVHEQPPVVVEHPAPTDCNSRKVVNFHRGGGKTTRTTTDCQ